MLIAVIVTLVRAERGEGGAGAGGCLHPRASRCLPGAMLSSLILVEIPGSGRGQGGFLPVHRPSFAFQRICRSLSMPLDPPCWHVVAGMLGGFLGKRGSGERKKLLSEKEEMMI